MSLWDRIKKWAVSNSEQLVIARMPDPEPAVELVADRAYFSLSLAHGFLDRDVNWFKRRYAAVHVSARLDVAGRTTTVTRLAQPAEGKLGPGVWLDYPVTGLVPYRGGTVEIEAGLSALERSSYLGAAVGILADFSALVAPPLSTTVAVAGKVTEGIQKVLAAGEEEIVLGLHEALAASGGGGNELAPGYLAVVKATEEELDPTTLSVHDSRLHVSDGKRAKPLVGFSYLLFRVDAVLERDDWRFERFDELIGKAIDAHFAGDPEKFRGFRNAVLAEVLKSPDLTEPDRFRIARAIAAELEQVTGMGLAAVGQPASTLEEIVRLRAAPIDDPVATSEISLQALVEGQL